MRFIFGLSYTIIVVFLLTITLLVTCYASDNTHEHPESEAGIHNEFYRTWMRPDNRLYSCCDKKDCYPAQARQGREGQWQVQRREDGAWLTVPLDKIEHDRDSPDGRIHACIHAPNNAAGLVSPVICFIVGSGS